VHRRLLVPFIGNVRGLTWHPSVYALCGLDRIRLQSQSPAACGCKYSTVWCTSGFSHTNDSTGYRESVEMSLLCVTIVRCCLLGDVHLFRSGLVGSMRGVKLVTGRCLVRSSSIGISSCVHSPSVGTFGES